MTFIHISSDALRTGDQKKKNALPDSEVTQLRESRPEDNKTESKEESFICSLPCYVITSFFQFPEH